MAQCDTTTATGPQERLKIASQQERRTSRNELEQRQPHSRMFKSPLCTHIPQNETLRKCDYLL